MNFPYIRNTYQVVGLMNWAFNMISITYRKRVIDKYSRKYALYPKKGDTQKCIDDAFKEKRAANGPFSDYTASARQDHIGRKRRERASSPRFHL